MYRVWLIVTREGDLRELSSFLDGEGLQYATARNMDALLQGGAQDTPDAVLLGVDQADPRVVQETAAQCHQLHLPVLSLVPREQVKEYDPATGADDFVVCPFRPGELLLRIRQAILRVRGPQSSQVIRVDDLSIDTERYEVRVAGRRVVLTYKEYELLKLLASTPGRVYSREAPLSQVWGYDYFGGTRTVDVHIRRLRSKIEDASHSFIETVWNVGYKFNPPATAGGAA